MPSPRKRKSTQMDDICPSPRRRTFALSRTSHFWPSFELISIPLNICIGDIWRVPVFGEVTPS